MGANRLQSIAIEALVLGGPESLRVVLNNSTSSTSCVELQQQHQQQHRKNDIDERKSTFLENSEIRRHTALRAPPWAFTQHIVSTNVLSSPRGIGILAQSPRRDQRGRRATHASDPPTNTSHHRVRTRHGFKAGSLSPPHTQYLSSRSG